MHPMGHGTQIQPLIPVYKGKLYIHHSGNRTTQDLKGITQSFLGRKKGHMYIYYVAKIWFSRSSAQEEC